MHTIKQISLLLSILSPPRENIPHDMLQTNSITAYQIWSEHPKTNDGRKEIKRSNLFLWLLTKKNYSKQIKRVGQIQTDCNGKKENHFDIAEFVDG